MMLQMSFYKGTLNKTKLKEFIIKTEKPIQFTYGFKFKNPTTKEVLKTKEEALRIVDEFPLLEATEFLSILDLNAYSGNDMW